MIDKRFLFWGLCVLLAGMSIFFIVIEIAYPNYERSQEQARNKGWTIYNQKYYALHRIAIDQQDRIWVTGGCSECLLVFDGEHWRNFAQEDSGLIGYLDIAIDSLGRVGIAAWPDIALIVFEGENWKVYYPAGNANGKINKIGSASLGTDKEEHLWVEVSYLGTNKPNDEFVLHGDDWIKCFDDSSELSDETPSTTNLDCRVRPVNSNTYIDDWGRIWRWRYDYVNSSLYTEITVIHSDGSHWLTISSENSALAGKVWGLVVDSSQRL